MARPDLHHDTLAPALLPGTPHMRYLVVRQEDIWFIKFDGEKYGPYKTEREAILFAIDAANKFGEQGEETQVLQMMRTARPGSYGPTGTTRIRPSNKFDVSYPRRSDRPKPGGELMSLEFVRDRLRWPKWETNPDPTPVFQIWHKSLI